MGRWAHHEVLPPTEDCTRVALVRPVASPVWVVGSASRPSDAGRPKSVSAHFGQTCAGSSSASLATTSSLEALVWPWHLACCSERSSPAWARLSRPRHACSQLPLVRGRGGRINTIPCVVMSVPTPLSSWLRGRLHAHERVAHARTHGERAARAPLCMCGLGSVRETHGTACRGPLEGCQDPPFERGHRVVMVEMGRPLGPPSRESRRLTMDGA